MCLPTTPFPGPKLGTSISGLACPRERISCLTSHGGLTGVPQVNLPGAVADGAPVGLSIIGGRGTDMSLLAVAKAFAGA
jgi:amidase